MFRDEKYKDFQDGISSDLSNFITAAKPLKLLQLAYENEKVGLPLVYPFYYLAMQDLKLLSSVDNTTVETIAES